MGMMNSDWLILCGLLIDIVGVVSLTASGTWWGTPNGLNYTYMKRDVDKYGYGRGWLDSSFGISQDDWERGRHQAVYRGMRRTAKWMLAWRWFSVGLIVAGFGLQCIGLLERILHHPSQ